MRLLSEVTHQTINNLKAEGFNFLVRTLPEENERHLIKENDFNSAIKYVPFKTNEEAISFYNEEDDVIILVDKFQEEINSAEANTSFYIQTLILPAVTK